eukprot:CAMPEP_0173449914 /NCGR_PEP_ID=MMETSP1357-20121228/43646_1 /TAXON_ID=77926 /ORGANISM="Hemiselmis rufescens, Strain PCC563" /LENGTH=82 /DNA_ID=CAMNT_0014416539 /DNA_START=52 /DNA_END=297 /DNA_ORIENTATION=+
MPSDAKAQRAAKRAEARAKKAQEGGATPPVGDDASLASTATAKSSGGKGGDSKHSEPEFFERSGKHAAQRSNMNMDIYVEGI